MGMLQRAKAWVGGFGVIESGRMFDRRLAESRALRAEDAALERALAGDSEPPAAAEGDGRDSGPDLFDGMTSGLRP